MSRVIREVWLRATYRPRQVAYVVIPGVMLRHVTRRSRRQHLIDDVRACRWHAVKHWVLVWRARPSELADAVLATDRSWPAVRAGVRAQLPYSWPQSRDEARLVRCLVRTGAILRQSGLPVDRDVVEAS